MRVHVYLDPAVINTHTSTINHSIDPLHSNIVVQTRMSFIAYYRSISQQQLYFKPILHLTYTRLFDRQEILKYLVSCGFELTSNSITYIMLALVKLQTHSGLGF